MGLLDRLFGSKEKPREIPKLGRNDPCWCGSGKKYKHCHMRQDKTEGGGGRSKRRKR